MKTFAIALMLLLASTFSVLAQACNWHKSLERTGHGIYQSEVFRIGGEKWRLAYRAPGTGSLQVYLHAMDGTPLTCLLATKYNASVNYSITGKIRPEWKLGYLVVKGSDKGWGIRFDQYVSEVDDWELTKDERDQLNPKKAGNRHLGQQKFGIWAGDGAEQQEIPLSVTSQHWKVTLNGFDKGRLKIQIATSDGTVLGTDTLLSEGKKELWVHQAGDFILKIESVSMPWSLEVEI